MGSEAALAPARTRAVFECIANALEEMALEVKGYIQEHSAFAEIGGRMLSAWDNGCSESLEQGR